MSSADNLAALSSSQLRDILAVPMRKVKDIATEVLTRPGRYKQVADNLQVKEVWSAMASGANAMSSASIRTRRNANASAVRSRCANSTPNWPCWSSVTTITRRRPAR